MVCLQAPEYWSYPSVLRDFLGLMLAGPFLVSMGVLGSCSLDGGALWYRNFSLQSICLDLVLVV